MPDPIASAPPDPAANAPRGASASFARNPAAAADAAVAIARLEAMSSDIRGCAILEQDSLLAASGDHTVWEAAARGLLASADAAAGEAVTQAHVGTEDGEAFAVRHRGYAIVAASDRFTLASLMFCDLRAALRDLGQGPTAAAAAATHAAGSGQAGG